MFNNPLVVLFFMILLPTAVHCLVTYGRILCLDNTASSNRFVTISIDTILSSSNCSFASAPCSIVLEYNCTAEANRSEPAEVNIVGGNFSAAGPNSSSSQVAASLDVRLSAPLTSLRLYCDVPHITVRFLNGSNGTTVRLMNFSNGEFPFPIALQKQPPAVEAFSMIFDSATNLTVANTTMFLTARSVETFSIEFTNGSSVTFDGRVYVLGFVPFMLDDDVVVSNETMTAASPNVTSIQAIITGRSTVSLRGAALLNIMQAQLIEQISIVVDNASTLLVEGEAIFCTLRSMGDVATSFQRLSTRVAGDGTSVTIKSGSWMFDACGNSSGSSGGGAPTPPPVPPSSNRTGEHANTSAMTITAMFSDGSVTTLQSSIWIVVCIGAPRTAAVFTVIRLLIRGLGTSFAASDNSRVLFVQAAESFVVLGEGTLPNAAAAAVEVAIEHHANVTLSASPIFGLSSGNSTSTFNGAMLSSIEKAVQFRLVGGSSLLITDGAILFGLFSPTLNESNHSGHHAVALQYIQLSSMHFRIKDSAQLIISGDSLLFLISGMIVSVSNSITFSVSNHSSVALDDQGIVLAVVQQSFGPGGYIGGNVELQFTDSDIRVSGVSQWFFLTNTTIGGNVTVIEQERNVLNVSASSRLIEIVEGGAVFSSIVLARESGAAAYLDMSEVVYLADVVLGGSVFIHDGGNTVTMLSNSSMWVRLHNGLIRPGGVVKLHQEDNFLTMLTGGSILVDLSDGTSNSTNRPQGGPKWSDPSTALRFINITQTDGHVFVNNSSIVLSHNTIRNVDVLYVLQQNVVVHVSLFSSLVTLDGRGYSSNEPPDSWQHCSYVSVVQRFDHNNNFSTTNVLLVDYYSMFVAISDFAIVSPVKVVQSSSSTMNISASLLEDSTLLFIAGAERCSAISVHQLNITSLLIKSNSVLLHASCVTVLGVSMLMEGGGGSTTSLDAGSTFLVVDSAVTLDGLSLIVTDGVRLSLTDFSYWLSLGVESIANLTMVFQRNAVVQLTNSGLLLGYHEKDIVGSNVSFTNNSTLRASDISFVFYLSDGGIDQHTWVLDVSSHAVFADGSSWVTNDEGDFEHVRLQISQESSLTVDSNTWLFCVADGALADINVSVENDSSLRILTGGVLFLTWVGRVAGVHSIISNGSHVDLAGYEATFVQTFSGSLSSVYTRVEENSTVSLSGVDAFWAFTSDGTATSLITEVASKSLLSLSAFGSLWWAADRVMSTLSLSVVDNSVVSLRGASGFCTSLGNGGVTDLVIHISSGSRIALNESAIFVESTRLLQRISLYVHPNARVTVDNTAIMLFTRRNAALTAAAVVQNVFIQVKADGSSSGIAVGSSGAGVASLILAPNGHLLNVAIEAAGPGAALQVSGEGSMLVGSLRGGNNITCTLRNQSMMHISDGAWGVALVRITSMTSVGTPGNSMLSNVQLCCESASALPWATVQVLNKSCWLFVAAYGALGGLVNISFHGHNATTTSGLAVSGSSSLISGRAVTSPSVTTVCLFDLVSVVVTENSSIVSVMAFASEAASVTSSPVASILASFNRSSVGLVGGSGLVDVIITTTTTTASPPRRFTWWCDAENSTSVTAETVLATIPKFSFIVVNVTLCSSTQLSMRGSSTGGAVGGESPFMLRKRGEVGGGAPSVIAPYDFVIIPVTSAAPPSSDPTQVCLVKFARLLDNISKLQTAYMFDVSLTLEDNSGVLMLDDPNVSAASRATPTSSRPSFLQMFTHYDDVVLPPLPSIPNTTVAVRRFQVDVRRASLKFFRNASLNSSTDSREGWSSWLVMMNSPNNSSALNKTTETVRLTVRTLDLSMSVIDGAGAAGSERRRVPLVAQSISVFAPSSSWDLQRCSNAVEWLQTPPSSSPSEVRTLARRQLDASDIIPPQWANQSSSSSIFVVRSSSCTLDATPSNSVFPTSTESALHLSLSHSASTSDGSVVRSVSFSPSLSSVRSHTVDSLGLSITRTPSLSSDRSHTVDSLGLSITRTPPLSPSELLSDTPSERITHSSNVSASRQPEATDSPSMNVTISAPTMTASHITPSHTHSVLIISASLSSSNTRPSGTQTWTRDPPAQPVLAVSRGVGLVLSTLGPSVLLFLPDVGFSAIRASIAARMLDCGATDASSHVSEDYFWLSFGAAEGQSYRGSIASCVVLCAVLAVFALLSILFKKFVVTRRAVDSEQLEEGVGASSYARLTASLNLPGRFMVGPLFFTLPTWLSSGIVLLSLYPVVGSVADIVLGAASILVALAIVGAPCRLLLSPPFGKFRAKNFDNLLAHRSFRHSMGSMFGSLPAANVAITITDLFLRPPPQRWRAHGTWMESFGCMFENYKRDRQWYSLAELVPTLLCSLLSAISVGIDVNQAATKQQRGDVFSSFHCEVLTRLTGAIQIASMFVLVVLRPHLYTWEAALAFMVAACGAAFGVLVMIPSCDTCVDGAAVCAQIQMVLATIVLVVEVSTRVLRRLLVSVLGFVYSDQLATDEGADCGLTHMSLRRCTERRSRGSPLVVPVPRSPSADPLAGDGPPTRIDADEPYQQLSHLTDTARLTTLIAMACANAANVLRDVDESGSRSAAPERQKRLLLQRNLEDQRRVHAALLARRRDMDPM